MMPNLDGSEALRQIREFEKSQGVPQTAECAVFMITAQDDPKTVFNSFYKNGATSYIAKPISRTKLLAELRKKKLIV
jgi:two-component system chemotaxis response regulator CheY